MLAAHCLVEVPQDVSHSIKAEACFFESPLCCRVARIQLGRLASSSFCGRKVKI